MFTSSRPPIAQNQIPKIEELQVLLGFQCSDTRSLGEFRGSTQQFRKEYLASDGTPGKGFTEWKSPRTQYELLQMARKFLESKHYGSEFWPATAGTTAKRGLEYPKDTEKLAELLQQLFWRQNINSARNETYRDRGHQIRETMKSDRGSVTTQHNKSHTPRCSNLSSRRPSSRSSPHRALSSMPPQKPFNTNSVLSSSSGENIDTVAHGANNPSSMHTRGWIPDNTVRIVTGELIAQQTMQLPIYSGDLESSENSRFIEDVYDYLGSDTDLGHQKSAPTKIVVLKYREQASHESLAKLCGDSEGMRSDRPKPRGIGAKASMLAHSQASTFTDRLQKLLPSNSKSPSERKGRKRKYAKYDDQGYTPDKRLNRKNIPTSTAKPKPRTPMKDTESGRGDPGMAPSVEHRSMELRSGLVGERQKSPIDISDTSSESTDCVHSPEPSAGDSPGIGEPTTSGMQYPGSTISPSTSRKPPDLIDQLRTRKKLSSERNQSNSMKQPSETNNDDQAERQDLQLSSPVSMILDDRPQRKGMPDLGSPDKIPQVAAKEKQPPQATSNPPSQSGANGDVVTFDGNADSAATFHGTADSQTPVGPGLNTPEPTLKAALPQPPDPKIDIGYHVIASGVKRLWNIQSLSGKAVQTVFDEVSGLVSKPDIHCILFKLKIEQVSFEYNIQRNNSRMFKRMIDDFSDDIMEYRKKYGDSKASIRVLLEPDPVEEGTPMIPQITKPIV